MPELLRSVLMFVPDLLVAVRRRQLIRRLEDAQSNLARAPFEYQRERYRVQVRQLQEKLWQL